uniref:Acyl-coenzyme A oxidase n=1 Tax=Prasinoderma coloniale TaxID=156133 RepID=A0A7R9T8Y4_9VIRI|eukprot:PRCOL_00006639-RA
MVAYERAHPAEAGPDPAAAGAWVGDALVAGEAADAEWAAAFRSALEPGRDLRPFDHGASTRLLQDVIRSGLLRLTDVRDNPERFFLAHRIIAQAISDYAPGFWVRFTVHYNLCFGTVVALGEERHLAELEAMERAGDVGCFGLTERHAGVNSGLVVETLARYDAASDSFVISSPADGACKNWISSGLQANKACVVADLIMPDGTSRGAHAFLVPLRERVGGALLPGVSMGDMGVKTIANDLDNAWIRFTELRVPHSALLSRYGDVVDGAYVQKKAGVKNFQMIGQRLFSGRVCVAQAAMIFSRKIFDGARRYADGKLCWSPDGSSPPLSDLPQLRSLFAEGQATLDGLDDFIGRAEAALCDVLRRDAIPSLELQQAIAVGKVACVERCISLLVRLKQDMGSYSLMAESGFQRADFLQMCKFAEGDSRILSQKMARDRMTDFAKGRTPAGGSSEAEEVLCAQLAAALAAAEGGRGGRAAAWNASWRTVYRLADAIQDRFLATWDARASPAARPEAIASRM